MFHDIKYMCTLYAIFSKIHIYKITSFLTNLCTFSLLKDKVRDFYDVYLPLLAFYMKLLLFQAEERIDESLDLILGVTALRRGPSRSRIDVPPDPRPKRAKINLLSRTTSSKRVFLYSAKFHL